MGFSVKEIICGLAKLDPSIRIQVLDLRWNYGYQRITDQIEVFSCGYRDSFGNDFINQSFVTAPVQLIYAIKNLTRPDIIHMQDWPAISIGYCLNSYWGGGVKSAYTTQLSYRLMLEDLKKESIPVPRVKKTIVDEIARLERECIRASDVSIFLNESEKQRLNGPANSEVIPHGIHLEEIQSIPFKKIKLPGKHPTKLLYFGRIDIMKNLGRLLDCKLPSEVDLIVMGGVSGSDPKLYRRLENLVGQRDNLHRISYTSGDDKYNIIRAADAVIFPSIYEPFGLVGIETLACGTPLIASFVGGMNEYLDDESAIRMHGLDVASMEKAIQRLVNMSKQSKKRMIAKGLEMCKKSSWAASIHKHYDVYRMLVQDMVRDMDRAA
jgi:glycosyltransferase involved in cell wall biosynthesis